MGGRPVEGRKVQLTDDFYENLNPRFDADGGYLYFLSYRNYQIGMDPFEDNHIVANPARVMVAQLRKGEKPPFVKRPATEPPPADEAETSAEKKDDPARVRVDVDGLPSRVYPLPVDPGNYFHLVAGKDHVAWSSVPLFTEDEYEEIYRPGGATKWTFHVFSMKDQKAVALEDKIAEAQASVNGEQLVLRKEKAVYSTSFAKAYESKKLGTEVDLSGMTYRVSPREEWRQIFADAWRWYRDFFYDKDMHGRDWKAMRAKFAPWVEEIRTRQQLNWLLSEMVGELSVSHTYVSGGDTGPSAAPPAPAVSAGLLGADLVADPTAGLYLVGIVNGQRTIDNGRVEQSNNAFYGKDGQWLVENHGADPDVLQDNYPTSVMAGKDLQLEKAVEVALQKIKDQPWQFPPVPPYPKR